MFLSLHHFCLFNALLFEVLVWFLLRCLCDTADISSFSFTASTIWRTTTDIYLPLRVVQFRTRKHWWHLGPRHLSNKMRTILLAMSCLLCLGLPLDALQLNGQRTLRPLRGEKLLKRVRRGWMWNQFFLQEEYTGSDYQYIGKVRPAPQPPPVTSANTNSLKTSHVRLFALGIGIIGFVFPYSHFVCSLWVYFLS